MDDQSTFCESRVLLKCAILPISMGYPLDAVRVQLNDMLLKYNEGLQGIPISFSKIEFDRGKECGRILDEQPWIHVDITTSVLLFKPAAGNTIHGKVNQISDSHVSLLVYGIFNASITSEELGSKYKYSHTRQAWESDTGDLQVDDLAACRILDFHIANGVLSINATMK